MNEEDTFNKLRRCSFEELIIRIMDKYPELSYLSLGVRRGDLAKLRTYALAENYWTEDDFYKELVKRNSIKSK